MADNLFVPIFVVHRKKTEVFLAFITRIRVSLELGDLPNVLLCDTCRTHVDGEIKKMIVSANARLVTVPSHALALVLALFQPLGFVRLRVLKREEGEITRDGSRNLLYGRSRNW
jgi:hypothetical protein